MFLGNSSRTKGTYHRGCSTSFSTMPYNFVTGLRRDMQSKLIPLYDKIPLRKRSVIETINDELKNVTQLAHSSHRGVLNFAMNTLATIAAYGFFNKKPSIPH